MLPVTIAVLLLVDILRSETEWHHKLYQAGGVLFVTSLIVAWLDGSIVGSEIAAGLDECLANPDIAILVKPLCFCAVGFATLLQLYGVGSLIAGTLYAIGIMAVGYQLIQRAQTAES